tara:strand:- start:2006 stop:3031 length:1026 start_codon:yes stop_codon:yes gene_type:complete
MSFGFDKQENKTVKLDMKPNELGFYSEKQIRAMKGVLSYSTLKSVVEDPISLIQGREDLSSVRGVTLGSLIDKMVFGEPIDDIAVVESFKIPTAKKLEIADQMVKDKLKGPEGFLNAARSLDIYKVNKDDVVMAKFDSDIRCYVNAKTMTAEGQRFISKDDYAIAQRGVEVLKSHRFTKKYFDQSQENIDVHYQAGLKAKVGRNEIKGLFDMFIVNHEHKVIVPCDLKTTGGKAKDFKEAFRKYSYALQAEMYSLLAAQWQSENGLKDYKLLPFRYVVLSTRDVENPFVYSFDFNKYKEKVVKPYSVKTLKDYIVEYNHVVKNQEFVYPSEMCRNGIMELY